jgi:hypothetical protein
MLKVRPSRQQAGDNKKLTRYIAVIESCCRARADVFKFTEEIGKLANRYHLQLIYAFGSRAKEAHSLVQGKKVARLTTSSDLDIGLKPERPLSVEEKVKIAVFFEDLFQVARVDVVSLPEAPVMLALEIVEGELLFAKDDRYEAEYQLYIMRLAAELAPYERMKRNLILEMQK